MTGEALDTTLAAIDIGTNSIHLVVARLVNAARFEMLTTAPQRFHVGLVVASTCTEIAEL